VKLLMEGRSNQNEKNAGVRATQDHAQAVRDLINQMKTSKDPNYASVSRPTTARLGEQHLRDFQDNEKTIPTILTTSAKARQPAWTRATSATSSSCARSTPSSSFKQIIGRGTRLYDGKDYFTSSTTS